MSGKVPKRAVNYRQARPRTAPKRCGTCSMFRPRTQTCTLVAGLIYSGDVCDRWEPRR